MDDQDKAMCRGSLGVSQMHRFERLASFPILKPRSKICNKRWSSPQMNPGTRHCASGISVSPLARRFQHRGVKSDIDASIKNLERAIMLIPGDLAKGTYLSGLGIFKFRRFDKGPAKVWYFMNPGFAQSRRFECLSDMSRYQCIGNDPPTSGRASAHRYQNNPPFFGNLGNSLRYRFERLGNLPNSETSIMALQRAVELTTDEAGFQLGNRHKPCQHDHS